MKQIIILMILVTAISCNGQNSNQTVFTDINFEKKILSFEPTKKNSISTKDFEYGLMILKETKKAVDNNTSNFNVADYFNILSAFLTLKESEKIGSSLKLVGTILVVSKKEHQ